MDTIIKTIGLVICGGKSSRMGFDKGSIVYHDADQRSFVYRFLSEICSEVFLSCRSEQLKDFNTGINVLTDDEQYACIGPMAALLSAIDRFSGCRILAVGCDYPFFTKADAEKLLDAGIKRSAAYFHRADDVFEPLLAVYHPGLFNLVRDHFKKGFFSLQEVLQKTGAIKIVPADERIITSVDDPAAKAEALFMLNK